MVHGVHQLAVFRTKHSSEAHKNICHHTDSLRILLVYIPGKYDSLQITRYPRKDEQLSKKRDTDATTDFGQAVHC